MRRSCWADTARLIITLFALMGALPAPAQDIRRVVDAYVQGHKLKAKEAAKLESKLAAKPENALDRVRLIAFYTFSPESPPPDEAAKGRRRHLLWLAEHEPESELWSQWSYGFSVYVKGDSLSDPEGFSAIREKWLGLLSRNPTNEKIRLSAAMFLEVGDPESAQRLMRGMRDSAYLGTLYARVLLGETALHHATGFPVSSDPTLRDTALAKQALTELQNSSDAKFIGQAGFLLARDGGILWSQNKLDWDYSPLATTLLTRARTLQPDELKWFLSDPSLPQPGVRRPIATIRIGGAAMEAKLLRKPLPSGIGRPKGARGTVVLDIAINGDGKVVRAVPKSGPSELYSISIEAVEQWVFQPTMLNGEPVNVITSVAIDD